jgi:hypothetical protein
MPLELMVVLIVIYLIGQMILAATSSTGIPNMDLRKLSIAFLLFNLHTIYTIEIENPNFIINLPFKQP